MQYICACQAYTYVSCIHVSLVNIEELKSEFKGIYIINTEVRNYVRTYMYLLTQLNLQKSGTCATVWYVHFF